MNMSLLPIDESSRSPIIMTDLMTQTLPGRIESQPFPNIVCVEKS